MQLRGTDLYASTRNGKLQIARHRQQQYIVHTSIRLMDSKKYWITLLGEVVFKKSATGEAKSWCIADSTPDALCTKESSSLGDRRRPGQDATNTTQQERYPVRTTLQWRRCQSYGRDMTSQAL